MKQGEVSMLGDRGEQGSMLDNGVMEQKHGHCPSATETGHAEQDIALYLVKHKRCQRMG